MAVTFCFDEAHLSGDSLTVRISPDNRSRPTFHHWVASCCLLAPDKMVAISALDPDLHRGSFVYCSELQFDSTYWCAKEPDEVLLVLPPAVEVAVREGRALVLVSMAHEGNRHFVPGTPTAETSVFDKLTDLAARYGLAPEQLWFVTGNLLAPDEERAWCAARSREVSPFTLRCAEISSFGVGLVARETFHHGRGVASQVISAPSSSSHCMTWQQTKVRRLPRPFSALGFEGDDDAGDPSWSFGCLNRSYRRHRLWTLERLFAEGLLDRGLVSFPAVSGGQIDEAFPGRDRASGELVELLERLPLHLDVPFASMSEVRSLAESSRAVTTTPAEVERDCAVQIVTESFYAEGRFATEKVFKALLGRGPAAVVGSWGTVTYLREIGAQTWDGLLDESYDLVGDTVDPQWSRERFEACMDAVLPLVSKPADAAAAARAAIPRRRHNLRWLMEADKPWDRVLGEMESVLAS